MKKSVFLVILVSAFLLVVTMCLVKAQGDASINTGTSITLGTNETGINETDVNETQEIDAAEQELEQENITLPNEKSYGWNRFKERFRLFFTWGREARLKYKMKLAQRRAAELAKMAVQNITEKYEIIARQYNKTMEDIENKLDKLEAKGKNVTELRERLQNMTYKHVLVLQRVLAKAPEAARAGLNNAILASQNQWLKLQIRFLRREGVNETLIQQLINRTRELREIRKGIIDELRERWRERTRGREQAQEKCNGMTLQEARQIALASECSGNCTGGCLKETYSCNSGTGTWWLDLEIEKQGCAPACVINIVNKTAEINWRCTGLVE